MRHSRYLVIFILLWATAFSGCTKFTQKFFYRNYLVSYAVDRVDLWFDLDSRQKDLVKSRFKKIHRWHQATQLKKYAADLRSLRRRLHSGLKLTDVNWLFDRVDLHRKSINRRVIPVAVKFLATLKKSQVDHLKKALVEENEDLEVELKLPKKERYEKKTNELLGQFEHFTGSFTSGQEKKIHKYIQKLPDTLKSWLQYRKIKQKEFVKILRSKPGKSTLKKMLVAYLLEQEKNFPAKYRAPFRKAAQQFKKMVVKIVKLLTKEQKKNVADRLNSYIELLDDLSG